MNTRRRNQSNVSRWLPVGAAGGLLAAVIIAGVVSGGGGGSAAEETLPSTDLSVPVDSSTTSTTYVDVETVPTGTPIEKVALDRTLSEGLAGDDVTRVQTRLKELGFDPGPIDGIYGLMTKQSVWAFEKLVMKIPRTEATGQVTPATWDHMQEPIKIKPRRPTAGLADHTEIYLPQQVLVVFHKDEPVLVTHISTGELDENGEPKEYREVVKYDTDINGNPLPEPVEKPIIGWAKTPPGVFTAYRHVSDERNGPLGTMWNPIYINQGIAIHGALTVPNKPASHGCIRVPMHISEYLQELIPKGQKVLIWDGKKEPEDQTAEDRQMLWDQLDLENTTTTTTSTTTTTTVAPTTVVPTTVAPTAPATTVPTTTTTTAPPNTTSSTAQSDPVDDL